MLMFRRGRLSSACTRGVCGSSSKRYQKALCRSRTSTEGKRGATASSACCSSAGSTGSVKVKEMR